MTNAVEFKKMLASDETKMNEYSEHVRKLMEEGIPKQDAAMKAAALMGYELSDEDLAAADKEGRELSLDELSEVSGGYFWAGDDAPDGHELECVAFFYNGWQDFYYWNAYTYCKGGQGQKHVFGDSFMYDYYLIGGDRPCRQCTLCGKIVPVEKRDTDRIH